MELKDAILKRRSIRSFTEKKVKDEDIKQILELGMAGPSAKNLKPWEFYVVKNEEVLNELRHVTPYTDKNAPVIIVVCGHNNEEAKFWVQDCSAAIENMLLAATDLNLGSLWCGIYPVEDRVNKVKDILNIEGDVTPLGYVLIGYPDEEKDPRTQYDDNNVHFVK